VPRALVIRTAGTNCDDELVRAFSLGGADVDRVHLHRLADRPALLDGYDLIGLPGGFSYGDDIASGRIFAMRVRRRLFPALRAAVQRGAPIIGICNGFQVLVQVGLLPGPRGPAGGESPWADTPPTPTLSLTTNASARFVDDWVRIHPEPGSVCVWTKGLAEAFSGWEDDALRLPVAHGEGRLVASSPGVIQAMESRGQVALRYGRDINGSEGLIAGVCDASGLVFGLMPHPERYLDWTRHPYWTRLGQDAMGGETPGLMMFRNAVAAACGQPV
jgi:phosphoribosylformylglycinamidine synthase subunit PurQ / glutaminase